MGIIYKHVNKINGKIYIGQTKYDINKRVGNDPVRAYSNSKKFSNDIIRYGWDNFESFILSEVDDDLLDKEELYWINYYNSIENGYNRIKSNQLKYLNRKPTKFIDFKNPDLLELYNQGYSLPELSYIYSTNYFNINRKLKEFNLSDNRNQGYLGIVKSINKKYLILYKENRKCLICGSNLKITKSKRLTFLCSSACKGYYSKLENKLELKKIYDIEDEKLKLYYKNLENQEIENHKLNLEKLKQLADKNIKLTRFDEFQANTNLIEFIDLINKNLKPSEIAKFYSVKKDLIYKYIKFNNIDYKRNYKVSYEDIIEDLKSDESLIELAKKRNISYNGYKKILQKYNIPSRKKDRILYRNNL